MARDVNDTDGTDGAGTDADDLPAVAGQAHPVLRAEPVVIASPDKLQHAQKRTGGGRLSQGRKVKSKAMKIIRRVHLYAGLMLLPWVLLFGISGFLFNHKTLLRPTPPTTITQITQSQVQHDLGFGAVDPQTLASLIVTQLNAQPTTPAGTQSGKPGVTAASDTPSLRALTLDTTYPASFKGLLSLSSKDESFVRTFTMDLNDGSVRIVQMPTPVKHESQMTPAPFAGKRVAVDALPMDGLADHVAELAKTAGVESTNIWAMGRKNSGPELRFKVLDESGRQWHVSYNTVSGKVQGRAANEIPETDFREIITSLHKQHHYPTEFGIPWLWILIADITALAMVFWGTSGLIMWWQLKTARVIGLVMVLLMSGVGYVIMTGALDSLYFVHH